MSVPIIIMLITAIMSVGGIILWYSQENAISRKITDKEVIELARRNNGIISAAILCENTALNANEARYQLQKMTNAGILKTKGFLGFGGGNYVLRDMQQLPENSHLQLSDAQIISIAIAQGGKITATALALKMQISVDIAKKKLDELQKNDIFEMNVTENGTIVYHLMDTSLLNP